MGTLSAEDGVLHGSPDTLGPTCGAADDFYYGTSSAASFIRQACCSIRRNPLSTSPVPPRQQQQQHLQQPHQHQRHVQQPVLGLATAFVLPPRQLADHLIDVYFRRVFYLYPFFHRPAFEASYRALFEGGGPSSTSSPTTGATNDSSINDSGGRFAGVGLGGSPAEGAHSAVFHCALNAVFAIATYHSNLPADEKPRAAEAFFLRAKEHIGIHLLEHNNLAAVQALLVTALFLQSTPYPGRCWNSVGIACRLAQGLGLHAELGAGRSQLQTEMRRRTWYGCVVLDM
jgi:hypothetical protein